MGTKNGGRAMTMRAMVMAAGAGTRLHPLTLSVPKPLVPIANRPVLEYTIELLKRYGIREMVLNLHSHPGQIQKYFGTGSEWGVTIRYSHEPKLLGTAGGVKKVSSFLKGDTFVILSGDGLTDVNLASLLAFHKRNHSIGTMALTPIDTRFDYGVTITGPNGRIKQFIEKPRWGDVFSNHVNTGIYVFEPSVLNKIPSGRPYDFGHDLWPALLQRKARIFGQLLDAYWCDVGNLGEYRRAQKDALDGKIRLPFAGRQIKRGVWVEDGARIGRNVRLEGPTLIGRNVYIGSGARIGPYTVIGQQSRIERNARLRQCTLWNHVRVKQGVKLDNCIIGHQALVSESISVHDGVILPRSV